MKTKVVMTALKAADPQSQAAQARTRPLLDACGPASSSDGGWVASDAAAEFIGRCYPPVANRDPQPSRELAKLTLRPAVAGKTVSTPLINCRNRTQRMTASSNF